ncbi:hypothetical protein Hanom_Chr11g01011381 [Helianthus anomalus]
MLSVCRWCGGGEAVETVVEKCVRHPRADGGDVMDDDVLRLWTYCGDAMGDGGGAVKKITVWVFE